MATQVRVTSIEVLESFRASLIIFLTKARRGVAEVGDEVRRTQLWLQHDRRVHWEGQVRKWRKLLDQAEQELFSAKLSALRDTTTAQQAAVRKAKHALEDAEKKLRNVKKWSRDFAENADPLMKGMEGLREYLDQDMPKAVTFLVQAQRSLDSYTEAPPPATAPAPVAEPEAHA